MALTHLEWLAQGVNLATSLSSIRQKSSPLELQVLKPTLLLVMDYMEKSLS
jgi:hypothetical protein